MNTNALTSFVYPLLFDYSKAHTQTRALSPPHHTPTDMRWPKMEIYFKRKRGDKQ